MAEPHPKLTELMGQVIVLDMASPFVFIGLMSGFDAEMIELTDADAHDLRDTPKTREMYVYDNREHGLHPNRRKVLVMRQDVISISRLEDVIVQ